jgi:4'-phosphopantetheinyl transferase EntD
VIADILPATAAVAVCWDRLLFSAKEAAGKLRYPLTGRWLATTVPRVARRIPGRARCYA